MSKAIEVIRDKYDKPLRIGGLAKKLGMSISGFHHHFGEPPMRDVERLRAQS